MGRPLSITFVTNNYLPYSGGVVSSIHAFYDELERQGHTVTIITLDFLGKLHQDERNVIRLNCPIKFRYNHNHMAVPFFIDVQMQRVLEKVNPDIVHVHHPFLLGPAACKVAQYLGKPVVFTYHTMYEKYIHYVPLPTLVVEPVVMRYVHDFCRKVHTIIAPSTTIQETLFNQGIRTSTLVIPSPIEPLFFYRQQCLQSQQRTRFRLVTVSRFTKEKNIPFLLDMFARLDHAHYELTLVGYGSELDALQYHAYTKLGLSDNDLQFIVKPTKEELARYYQDADLFVYASQTETQGLVMLEAMASGTPVIALHGPGQQDFVHDNVNGYLVIDADSMINTIQRVAADKAWLQQLKEGAIETAQQYAPQHLTNKLTELYTTLIKK